MTDLDNTPVASEVDAYDKAKTVIISNAPNNVLTRCGCVLCGGSTNKQPYLFGIDPVAVLPDGTVLTEKDGNIVCDDCAEHPEKFSTPAVRYITEVIPCPEDLRRDLPELYSEDYWPNWMRERVGLSPN